MNKKFLFIIIALAFLLIPFKAEAKELTINLFYGKECPHCEDEQKYLDTLKKQYGDNIEIKKFEVWHDSDNNDLLTKVRKALDNEDTGVPYTVIGTYGFTGYSEDIADKIRNLVKDNIKEPIPDIIEDVKKGKEISEIKKIDNSDVTVPLLGKVDAKTVSLPLLAVVVGLADGFNPCAMWVLLFLISMLLGMKNRRRMWMLGVTFILTSAVMYTLFMVAWLHIAASAMQQVILRTLIALVAIVAGAYNLNKYFKEPDGCGVTNKKQRKQIFEKIKKFTKEKSLILALVGVITLAITVNLVELACSAGLPLLFTSVLAMNDLNAFEYGLYIFIYIFFFLIDDIIIFLIAMKTMEIKGISTKYGKYSSLIGGVLMLLIGALLILKPEWIMFNF
ncbi:MAG: hypothetical protein HFH47_00620 [Bacilli bacterium]|nr:hypothetical protein [Bacilli bacterium]